MTDKSGAGIGIKLPMAGTNPQSKRYQ